MFGMLDYRAHKLYVLLFSAPNIIIWLIAIFVYPILSYAIGFNVFDFIVWQILLSIASYLIVGIAWTLFVSLYLYLSKNLFSLIIDVVPADGRNEDEAEAVLYGGKRVVDMLNFEKNLKTADDRLIDRLASYGFFSIFFRGKIKDRLYFVRDYYICHPDLQPSELRTEHILKENNLSMSLFETILTNPMYRNWVFQTVVFLFLIVYRPIV